MKLIAIRHARVLFKNVDKYIININFKVFAARICTFDRSAKIWVIKDMKGFESGIWLILLTALFACSQPANKPIEEPLRTDAPESNNDVHRLNIQVHRFDQDLFSISKDSFTKDTTELYRKYNRFFDLFTSQIIRVGNKKFPLFRENVLGFTNDPDIRSVYNEVQRQYPDLDAETEDFDIAFSRFHAVFPDSLLPKVNTLISGFNYNIVLSDSTLSVGLDMYLGDSCRFYEMLALPAYKTKRMNRDNIVSDAMKGFLIGSFENNHKDNDLISRMLYEGKIIYLITQFLPHYKTSQAIGYSEQEERWCSENEGKIWSHFIDKKLFYSSDFNDELIYINDGPFTKGFPNEAPPKIGVWLGYQIIKSYMNKNQETTINQLMELNDAHEIFNKSGYKPIRS